MEDAVGLGFEDDFLATGDHRVVSPGAGYTPDMERLWTYPNPFGDVHGSHKAPAPRRGHYVGSLELTHSAPLDNDRGWVFHVTGNMGQHFLFTTDGLYLSELFSDSRTGAGNPAEYRRGMNLDKTSFGQEGWGGYFWRFTRRNLPLTPLHPRQVFLRKREFEPNPLRFTAHLRFRVSYRVAGIHDPFVSVTPGLSMVWSSLNSLSCLPTSWHCTISPLHRQSPGSPRNPKIGYSAAAVSALRASKVQHRSGIG
jgi:hypothetical protein